MGTAKQGLVENENVEAEVGNDLLGGLGPLPIEIAALTLRTTLRPKPFQDVERHQAQGCWHAS
jgi:hypothetical protein